MLFFNELINAFSSITVPLDTLIKSDKRWGEIHTWRVIKQFSSDYTDGYYLASFDLKRNFADDKIESIPEIPIA